MVYDGVARGVYRRALFIYFYIYLQLQFNTVCTVYSLQFTVVCSTGTLVMMLLLYMILDIMKNVKRSCTGARAYKKIITCVV